MVINVRGEAIAQRREIYALRHDARGATFEQDPEMLWNAARLCLAGLARDPAVDANRIAGISLSAQMSSHLLVDADGNALTRFVSWADQRAEKQSQEMEQAFSPAQLRDLLGASLRPGPSWPFPRLKWWRENEPALLARARYIVQPKDWLLWKLCRNWVSDLSSLRGFAHQATGKVSTELSNWAGLPIDLRLPLAEPDSVAGTITPDLATELGLPRDLAVITGWNDLAAGALGSVGLTDEPMGFDITGTSEHLGVRHSAVTGPDSGCTLADIPLIRNYRLRYGVTSSSGQVLDWYWKTFREKSAGESGYAELAFEVESIGPGADGLLFLPSLNGERAPWFNPRARGVLFGLSSRHSHAEMSRAVLEGITFLLLSIQRQLPIKPREIRICGGCGAMPAWNQMKADIFGVPVTTMEVSEAGCLGAAILAARALGFHSSLEDASKAMIRPARTYQPQPKWTEFYSDRHAAFEKLYLAVEPCFRDANNRASL